MNYFFRAAIDFSAAFTRSTPTVFFHLSYTGRVALTIVTNSPERVTNNKAEEILKSLLLDRKNEKMSTPLH